MCSSDLKINENTLALLSSVGVSTLGALLATSVKGVEYKLEQNAAQNSFGKASDLDPVLVSNSMQNIKCALLDLGFKFPKLNTKKENKDGKPL